MKKRRNNSDDEFESDAENSIKNNDIVLKPILPSSRELLVDNKEDTLELDSSFMFQMLDDLVKDGNISSIDSSFLKSKYINLNECLKGVSVTEAQFLKTNKINESKLDYLKLKLGEIESYVPSNVKNNDFEDPDDPDGNNELITDTDNIITDPSSTQVEDTNEMLNLRKHKLATKNEHSQIKDRQYQLQYKMNNLLEERALLKKELSRLPSPQEIEERFENLKKDSTNIRRDIGQRSQETKMLKNDTISYNSEIHENESNLASLSDEIEKLKSELVMINSVPSQLTKEIDRCVKLKQQTGKNHEILQHELEVLNQTLIRYEQQKGKKSDQLNETKGESNKLKEEMNEAERLISAFTTDLNTSKEKEIVLLGDRATMDINLKHLNIEKRAEQDVQSRCTKDKDREVRNLKKSSIQQRFSNDQYKQYRILFERAKEENEILTQPNHRLIKQREDVQKEVEALKRALSIQKSLSAMESIKVDNFINEEEGLLVEQSQLRIEVVELARLASIKNEEREQKSRDYKKSELRFNKTIQDLKDKDIIIREMKKKYTLLHRRLDDYAKMFGMIKNERNKCVNSIQIAMQKNSELTEKIKIYENELEILRTNCSRKEAVLRKKQLTLANEILVRDNIKSDLSKHVTNDEKLVEQREQQKMEINRLNQMINKAEEQMIYQRKRYDQNIKIRNERGVYLVKQNAEVCLFYEKLNTQERFIKNAQLVYKARLDDINDMKLEISRENHKLAISQKNVPTKHALMHEIEVLDKNLETCRERKVKLESYMEDPNYKNRSRILDGKDVDPLSLHEKLVRLEKSFSRIEQRLLEKDIILRQVNKLVDGTKEDFDSRQSETFQIGNQVNELKRSIKNTTDRMKALIAEVSLYQTQKYTLQKEKDDNEQRIKDCYENFDNGVCPNREIAHEWSRYSSNLTTRKIKREAEEKMENWQNQHILTNGGYTTADPRPNAYIPDTDSQLPIPKPYGINAPFKPSKEGSSMRHIRNPVIKDIEI